MPEQKRPGFYDGPVRGLSISVIFFGCMCLGLGISELVIALTKKCTYTDYSDSYRSYDQYGERYMTTTTTTPRTYVHMCNFSYTFASPGIWSGLMFIASGIIGVLAARRKTTCFIVSMMALSLVTAWVAVVSIIISLMGSITDSSWMSYDNRYPISLFIQNGLVTLFSLVCLILSLIKFGFAARAVCCNGSSGLPAMKQSGPLYGRLPPPAYMHTPMAQSVPMQGVAPAQVYQQNVAQPIYLVQGHQVIGMLPPNMQQQPAPVVYPAATQAAVPSTQAGTDAVPPTQQNV